MSIPEKLLKLSKRTRRLKLLDGTTKDSEIILWYFENLLVRKGVDIMNNDTLPRAVALFPEDVLPTNERNLTDVRTRIGILLEYEFAQAVTASLPRRIKKSGLTLTYVVANQFPDLAFRAKDGRIGIRFEVKAIEAIAEEKSANFSTLIKDIRKDTDFVVVLLWEWNEHESGSKQYPHIESFYVMDAYELAQMRDCKWLNSPPPKLETTRQGFDLTFAVNARRESFNREEGNLGKLMRIFNPEYLSEASVEQLPTAVQQGTTLKTYGQFAEEAVRLGLYHIGRRIAEAVTAEENITDCSGSDPLPVCLLVKRNESRLVIVGHRQMLTEPEVMAAVDRHDAQLALSLNEKFKWRVWDKANGFFDGGSKPAQAIAWATERSEDFIGTNCL